MIKIIAIFFTSIQCHALGNMASRSHHASGLSFPSQSSDIIAIIVGGSFIFGLMFLASRLK